MGWGLAGMVFPPPSPPGLIAACRSEGLDPNGICYPCVMGWGLAGPGNSSAAVAAAPQNVCLLGNGFLRERVEYERSRRDTTAILIVRTLRFFLWTLKK